jgi:dipeptidyl-peptidase 4
MLKKILTFCLDTMYTERYMGLPTAEDNLAGYEAGDVTLLAEKLRGHDFYIMHGNADDNVHYQNAAKLYKVLAELDIPFEQMVSILS